MNFKFVVAALFCLLSASFSFAQVSDSTTLRATCAEITVSGDQSKVLRAIGDLVASKKIQTFMIKGVGREGGFWGCIVPFGDSDIINKLSTIVIDSDKTQFSVKAVQDCR